MLISAEAVAARNAVSARTEKAAYREEALARLTPDDLKTIYHMRKTRQILGMTQAEFGRLLGANQSAVAMWETGVRRLRNPKIVEYALKYILNTHVTRRPMEGLAVKLKEIQEKEQQAYEDAEKCANGEAGEAKAGTEQQGDDCTK